MQEHNVNEVMETTLDKIKSMIDVNTIVGEAIVAPDGTLVIPISKVGFGFFSGGGEFEGKNSPNKKTQEPVPKDKVFPFASGAGAGVSLQPIGFVVVKEDKVTMLPVNYNSSLERIIETLPTTITQLKDTFKK